jgi:hypothetical protein
VANIELLPPKVERARIAANMMRLIEGYVLVGIGLEWASETDRICVSVDSPRISEQFLTSEQHAGLAADPANSGAAAEVSGTTE